MNSNLNAASAVSNPALDNSNSAKYNVEELSMLINVPYDPDDMVWKVSGTQKHLTAVFHFSPEDTNRVASEAAVKQPPENLTLSSESWFPPELIAQSEMTGDDSLHGVAYSADAFFQEPYTSGRLIRIDATDYFVLELTSR